MNKGKQIIYTILGISCVGILFCAAIISPKYYNMFYDNKTLNQITYMDVSFRMYETPYESFQQKVKAIADCTSKDITLHAVKVNEVDTSMDNEKLTNIVKEELKVLVEKQVLVKKVKINENMLSSREMYTIYTTNEEKNIKGIHYWKLVYDGEDYSVTIILDTEYHKVYDILVKSNIPLDEKIKIYEKENYGGRKGITDKGNVIANSSSVAMNINEYMKEEILGNVDCVIYMEMIIRYYGFEEYNWYFPKEMDYKCIDYNFQGSVEFDDVILRIGQRLEVDEYGYGYWSGGINLEEKIQF